MNALWLNRISSYKHSAYCIKSVKRLIEFKIEKQGKLLKRYKKIAFVSNMIHVISIQDILLEEARAAKYFWRHFRNLLPAETDFKGRIPHAEDITNRLLDIGYHHLTNKIKSILEDRAVSPAIGLLHNARSTKSAPLAYDLVEMFRSDVVDAEVLRFLRLKKKMPISFKQKDVVRFLGEINERSLRKFYVKGFGTCQTYEYYMELQILRFIKAVNHNTIFEPLYVPTRHEDRC